MKRRKVAILEREYNHYIGRFDYTGENDDGFGDVGLGGYAGEIGEIVKRVNPVFSRDIPEERFEEEKQRGLIYFLHYKWSFQKELGKNSQMN